MAQALSSRIDKWDLMKLESFCKVKVIVSKTNRQPTDWEKSSVTSNRGLIPKIYKELKKLLKTQTTQSKMGYRINREVTTEEPQMAEKQLKKCSKSLVTEKCESKRP
jgi:(p)ppGpp synthase/HD superfamily hydrolase